MKLKKIASLALAGVMAVSMLAGCATKTETGNNGEGEGQVETALSIVDALNQAQSKVKFTNNDTMNAALQAMLSEHGIGFMTGGQGLQQNITATLERANIEESTIDAGSGFEFGYNSSAEGWVDFKEADLTGLKNGALNYYYDVNNGSDDYGDKTYTAVTVKEFKGYADATAALKAMSSYMDKLVEKLPETSTMTTETSGTYKPGVVAEGKELQYNVPEADKYYTMSYTGNAAVITLNNTNGTTSYLLVFVINQDVEVAEFKA